MRFLSILVFAGMLNAWQNSSFPNFPSVQAQGSAKISARPDQVKIDIGVVSQGRTAAAAAGANATLFNDVMAELKKVVGTAGEIQTVSYQVHPDYKYPKEGGTPSIASYTATNVVRVTSPNVDKAGEIIDAAGAKGANTVRGIQFGVRDERAFRAKALGEAVRNAKANAEAMAAGLGMKLSRVIRIEEAGNTPPVRPQLMMMREAAADSAATQVAPGAIELEVSVLVTAEITN